MSDRGTQLAKELLRDIEHLKSDLRARVISLAEVQKWCSRTLNNARFEYSDVVQEKRDDATGSLLGEVQR